MLDKKFLIFFLASVEIFKARFSDLKLLELPRLIYQNSLYNQKETITQ